jgi:uncharacterized protein YehS (DUF1456 family)
MTNNDILKRLRYVFNFSDTEMIETFELADFETNRAQVSNWLKKEDDAEFIGLNDVELALFLNGLINKNRGKREGEQPAPEVFLDNNAILKKIKIALTLKSDDILAIFKLADITMSPHELSAFLRNPNQTQFTTLNDQYLRNFLMGLQKKYRPDSVEIRNDGDGE